ncbi:MAG: hypothetical protein UGF89_06585 [Acutalibacteraceae bacterium]|nr:hypothetical protein [Acutalibacteraceae bacterium]
MATKIKGIPSAENIILHRNGKNGDEYKITENEAGTSYTIYKLDGDKATKLGKGSNPLELEDKYVKD